VYRITIGKELCQLIIAVGSVAVILDLKVRVAKDGECSTIARRELQLAIQNGYYLHVFLISDKTVDRLCVLAVWHGPELIVHFQI
jgi:hypothetical protein